MSGAKREVEDRLRAERHSRILLRNAGAIRQCEVHENVYIDNDEHGAVEEAARVAEAEIAAGSFPLPKAVTLREVMDAVMAEAVEDCPHCLKD